MSHHEDIDLDYVDAEHWPEGWMPVHSDKWSSQQWKEWRDFYGIVLYCDDYDPRDEWGYGYE